MAAPFDPSQHPRAWHGEFSPTDTRDRSLGRSLQSVNQDHPPGGWGHVLSMAYGGVMGTAGNVSATISYDAAPTIPSQIVHVAGWVGVSGGENHWLQVGIAFLPSGEARLYAESRDAKGRYDFRDLGAATPHTAYRMAVVKAGKVWVATVNGRRVGAVRVPGVDTSGVSAEVASSTYQPTAATYRLHFRDVKAPGAGKPAGKPGAQVSAVKGGFDAYSSPAVSKSDKPAVASIRKRAYPVLVRSHVRGGQLDEQVKAELARYLDANPALRAGEAADHGFDPAADPAKYLAAERAEGYHDSLKGSGPVDMTKLLAWEREESSEYANGVRKEQPSVSDVHVDAPLGDVSVGSGKKKRKPKVEDVSEPELAVKVIKADAAKQLVYGIVLEPHRVDSQGDWEDHGDIEDACHRYLGQVFKEGVTDLVNLQHRWQAPAGVYPVENYIAPADFELNGEPVAKGSWVLVVKVGDPAVWQQVLDGEWGGLSVEGTGVRDYDRPAPVAKAEPDIEKALGARLIGWMTGADPVVKEQPAPVINVHVPAQEPPVVNVHNEIPAPIVKDSEPPVIHVHVPEQPAPTVHVEPAAVTVEAPEVHVHQEHVAPRPVRVEERRGVKRYIPE